MVRSGLGGEADFSYWQCYEALGYEVLDGPIAQLDRVTDFYSVGCRFESCWDRQDLTALARPGRHKPAPADSKQPQHGFGSESWRGDGCLVQGTPKTPARNNAALELKVS